MQHTMVSHASFALGCHMLACPLSLVVRGVDVDVDVDVCVCARLRSVTASWFLAWIGSSVLVGDCVFWLAIEGMV